MYANTVEFKPMSLWAKGLIENGMPDYFIDTVWFRIYFAQPTLFQNRHL